MSKNKPMKYSMPAPNADFWVFSRLADVRRLIDPETGKHQRIFHIEGSVISTWLQAAEFEQRCLADEGVRTAMAAVAAAGYKGSAVAKLAEAIETVFTEIYLTAVADSFYNEQELITQWFMARQAAEESEPEFFAEEPVDVDDVNKAIDNAAGKEDSDAADDEEEEDEDDAEEDEEEEAEPEAAEQPADEPAPRRRAAKKKPAKKAGKKSAKKKAAGKGGNGKKGKGRAGAQRGNVPAASSDPESGGPVGQPAASVAAPQFGVPAGPAAPAATAPAATPAPPAAAPPAAAPAAPKSLLKGLLGGMRPGGTAG